MSDKTLAVMPRLSAPEPTKILWIDMDANSNNPSMQHLVASRNIFTAQGLDFGVVCETCHPDLNEKVKYRLKKLPIGNLSSVAFSLRANILFLLKIPSTLDDYLTHSTGANLVDADLVSIHFIPSDWFALLLHAKRKGLRDWAKLPIYGIAGLLELAQRHFGRQSHFHVVSKSLGDSLQRKGVLPENISVIPTPYDSEKYSVAARDRYRCESRKELSLMDSDLAFSFVSQGHYHRKGLFIAVEIVSILRARGRPAHLVIIGGKGSTWLRMRHTLTKKFPNSRSWLHILGFVPDIVRTLSATDAFLFPSLYEGFAAVEVEAAAMGLPLIVTNHPGTELLLKEGENGWFIDFEPELAAEKIDRLFAQIRPMAQANVGQAITLDVWRARIVELYKKLAAKRTTDFSKLSP